MTTEVVIVRHGETSWNKEGRLQGQHDPPLNGQGNEQAANLGEYVASGSLGEISAVYTSDLARAEQTALAISERLGRGAPVSMKDFREKKLGVIEGLTLEEAAVREPEAYERWRKGKGCPGAEDKSLVDARIKRGLDEILNKHKGQKVLLVTHGGILNSIHKLLTGTKFPGKIPNTSKSTIKKDEEDKQWKIESYACCSHMVSQGVQFDNRAFGGIGDTG